MQNDDIGIRGVQIVGSDPNEMVQAVQFNEDADAQIIDINMECPSQKSES